jgi:hypothetical protein
MKKLFFAIVTFNFFLCSLLAQFQEVPTPSSNALYSGAATTITNPPVIWVCGANGTVYRGRVNFTSLTWVGSSGNVPNTINLFTIAAIDSSTAFVGGNIGTNAFIYKTTNGGSNWVQQFSQTNGRMNAIWMRNASTGFAEGNPVSGRWSLWRTTNGGTNWDSTGRYLTAASNDSGYNNSLWCIGDTILLGTNNSKIYYSSNYGISWSVQSTSPEVNIYSIYWDFAFGTQKLFAGSASGILQSTNFGMNWSIQQNVPGTGNIQSICSYTPGVNPLTDYYTIYSRSNKIYEGQQGPNWNQWYTAPAGNYTYLFQKRNEPPPRDQFQAPIVGVRDNGGVSICFSCRWGSVRRINNEVPASYSLYQNYPNPFNPVTKIKFDVPAVETIHELSLRIYDPLGREITTLVNELLKPGTYEIEWNANDFPSGVYYYQLQITNYRLQIESSETRRMVLIK